MWNLRKTNSAKPLWNHGKTLVEPSAEPFGSPKRICPREPLRVRKQFCPETFTAFTMTEEPKVIAVGEKFFDNWLRNHHSDHTRKLASSIKHWTHILLSYAPSVFFHWLCWKLVFFDRCDIGAFSATECIQIQHHLQKRRCPKFSMATTSAIWRPSVNLYDMKFPHVGLVRKQKWFWIKVHSRNPTNRVGSYEASVFISLASYYVKFCPFASQLGLSVRKLSNVVRRHTPWIEAIRPDNRWRHRMPLMSLMSVTHTQLTPSQAARSHRSGLRFLSLEAVCLRDQHLYLRLFTLTISTLHSTTGQCDITLSIQLTKKIQHDSWCLLDNSWHKITPKRQNSTSNTFLRRKTRTSPFGRPLLRTYKTPRPSTLLPRFHVVVSSEQRRGSPSAASVLGALCAWPAVQNWAMWQKTELRKKSTKLQFERMLSRIFYKKCLFFFGKTLLAHSPEERVWAFCLATHDLTAGVSSLKQNRIHDNYAGSKENCSTLIATKIGHWICWYNGQQYCVYVLFPNMHFNNWGTEFHLQWSSWMQSHLGIV